MNTFLSLIRKITRYSRQSSDLHLLRESAQFDAGWYLANNPDVAKTKMDPLLHYYRHGGFEGRDPSVEFSSSWYLDTYADVKKAGINPLVHYLKYGRTERRSTHIASIQSYNSKETTLAQSFLSAYISEIASNIYNDHEDNYDSYRFGPQIKEVHETTPKTVVPRIFQKKKHDDSDFLTKTLVLAIGLIEPFLSRFDDVFTQLADSESRDIYSRPLA